MTWGEVAPMTTSNMADRTGSGGCEPGSRNAAVATFRKGLARWMARAGWCVVVATVALFGGARADAIVTLRVMSSDAEIGGPLPLVLSVSREPGDGSTASSQLDLIYRTEQLDLAGTCADGGAPCATSGDCGGGACELLCEKDARLQDQDFNATFPEFQNVDPGERRVRLRLLAPIQVELPLPTFADGILAMCMFQVDSQAPVGPITMRAERVEVGDEESNVVPAQVVFDLGEIVTELPTATPTPSSTATPTEQPTATPTAAVSATPTPTTVATNTPTNGVPTATPTTPPATVQPTATPIPTNTVRPPTPTSTMEPTTPPATATATFVPPMTPTATQPIATPTSPSPSAKRQDDDGCAIVPSAGGVRGAGLWWLVLPAIAFGIRRRWSRA